MNLEKKLLKQLRNAAETYEMIEDGDRILIGLSGGKDSLVLLSLLKRYQDFNIKPLK